MRLRYVITGCAGSGTGWASRVMTDLGSVCGHENMYGFHTPPPPKDIEGDAAWEAIGRLPDDIPVLLLIRNPLHVVRSEMALNYFIRDLGRKHQYPGNDAYIRQTRPGVFRPKDRLGRVLRYVARWDADVIAMPNVEAIRIEDIDAASMATIYRLLTGRNPDRSPAAVLASTGTSFNTHGGGKQALTWDDIRAHSDGAPLIAKARRWGYL